MRRILPDQSLCGELERKESFVICCFWLSILIFVVLLDNDIEGSTGRKKI